MDKGPVETIDGVVGTQVGWANNVDIDTSITENNVTKRVFICCIFLFSCRLSDVIMSGCFSQYNNAAKVAEMKTKRYEKGLQVVVLKTGNILVIIFLRAKLKEIYQKALGGGQHAIGKNNCRFTFLTTSVLR